MKNRLGCLGFLLLITLVMAIIGFAINDEETTKEESKEQTTEQVKKEEQELAEKVAEQKSAKEARLKQETEQKAKDESERQDEAEQAQAIGLEAVIVSRVVDGDTVELSDKRKIRLVGVNTPESTNRHEEYGKEASNYTTTMLEGKQVWIQKDVSETDRYQRYLRIIWLSIPTDEMNESEIRSKMFNADLVINGYAEPSTYPPDVKYSEYFVKFAREARDNKTGLWGFGINGTTKGDLDPKETVTKSNTSTPKTSTPATKPNTSTTNPKPSTPPATTSPPASTGGSESYKNCTELRKVYPNGVPSTHQAYESKHDRDKDNWACEKAS